MLYFEPKGRGTDLAAALQYLNRVLVRRSVVFLISDFLAPDFSRPLTPAARRHDVVAMPVIDPGEEHLPDVGLVALEDAETGELVELDTGSRSVRARYAEAARTRRKALDKLFAARRIDAVPLATNADAILALRAFFERRERRLAA